MKHPRNVKQLSKLIIYIQQAEEAVTEHLNSGDDINVQMVSDIFQTIEKHAQSIMEASDDRSLVWADRFYRQKSE